MGSEKFCLRWNDFESNISSTLRELRDDKDFFDVTLACDDEQIQAHKVILSACSPFFRNVLRRNPHQHPLLYLKGVKYTDLQSVLNFMYHGEVNVAQEELNSFLAVAEDLRVKGLTQNQSGGGQSSKRENSSHQIPINTKTSPHSSSTERDPAPPKRPRPPPPISQPNPADDDDIQEVVPVKSEPREPPLPMSQNHAPVPMYTPQQTQMTHALAATENDSLAYPADTYEEYDSYGGEEDMQAYDGAMMGDMGGEGNKGDVNEMLVQTTSSEGKAAWKCLVCGKDFLTKGNGGRHIETMHYNAPSLECEVCGKVLKNKNSHQNHMYIVHGHKKRGRHANQNYI